jgi:hypothetical protein
MVCMVLTDVAGAFFYLPVGFIYIMHVSVMWFIYIICLHVIFFLYMSSNLHRLLFNLKGTIQKPDRTELHAFTASCF